MSSCHHVCLSPPHISGFPEYVYQEDDSVVAELSLLGSCSQERLKTMACLCRDILSSSAVTVLWEYEPS